MTSGTTVPDPDANVWFTSKVTDAIEKKFKSVIWHHENVVKSAQHHRLAP
jgi:hypothetical protein